MHACAEGREPGAASPRFILTRAEIPRPSCPAAQLCGKIALACGRQEFRQVRLAGVLLLSQSKASCPQVPATGSVSSRVLRFLYSLLCSCLLQQVLRIRRRVNSLTVPAQPLQDEHEPEK